MLTCTEEVKKKAENGLFDITVKPLCITHSKRQRWVHVDMPNVVEATNEGQRATQTRGSAGQPVPSQLRGRGRCR